jgi:hypothetical protein
VLFIIMVVELLISDRRYLRVWLHLAFVEVNFMLRGVFALLHLL